MIGLKPKTKSCAPTPSWRDDEDLARARAKLEALEDRRRTAVEAVDKATAQLDRLEERQAEIGRARALEDRVDEAEFRQVEVDITRTLQERASAGQGLTSLEAAIGEQRERFAREEEAARARALTAFREKQKELVAEALDHLDQLAAIVEEEGGLYREAQKDLAEAFPNSLRPLPGTFVMRPCEPPRGWIQERLSVDAARAIRDYYEK